MHRKINDFFGTSLPRLITLPWGWFHLLLAWICTAYMLYSLQLFSDQPGEISFFREPFFRFTGVGIALYLLLFVTMPRLFDPYFNCTHWTLGREVSHMLLYYLLLLIFMLVYASRGAHTTEGSSEFHILSFRFLSFILPVTGLTFFRLTFYLVQHRKSPETVDAALPPESIPAQMLDLTEIQGGCYPANDVLFSKVDGNYNYLNYLSADRQVVKILKISLIKLERLLKPYPQFVKCHNKFIVNTDNITKSCGPKRKMILQLQHCKTKIPVSKQHADEFIRLINNNNLKKPE